MDELELERFHLVCERIVEIAEEEVLPDKYAAYFRAVASYLIEVIAYRRAHVGGCLRQGTMEELAFWQEKLYAPILPEHYKTSFANPAHAVEVIGENGGLLSAVFADLLAMPVWVAQEKNDRMLIFMELFVQLYGCVEECKDEAYADDVIGERLFATVYWFYHDYTEIFAADAIVDMIAKTDSFLHRLVESADAADGRYLYAYGYYVGENEKKLAAYMATLSEDAVQKMADTFTEGYRIGFIMTRKDITKKKTVRIDYPVGMERMVKKAVENFAKMGLTPTFSPQAMLSVDGRGTSHRSVFSVYPNRQFLYDHKDDKGYYFDARYVNRRTEVVKATYEAHKEEAADYGGPAVVEMFGEPAFTPKNQPENYTYTKEQNELNVKYANQSGMLTDRYIPGDTTSYTIISYPYPTIGERFEEIFDEVVRINTLDYMKYRDIQQKLIDLLDQGEWVHVVGKGENCTDMRVNLHPVKDPARETKFENCVADVNIPVGEVFTSPVLEGTGGTLFVSHVYLGDYEYRNLKLVFVDGKVTDYTCTNFSDEAENKKLIYDNILYRHETLPIGEFAIGTNTTAYRMAKDYGIFDKLPILIAEKTGPHFAVGDTCYSHAEDVAMYNPDGKEVIARDNSCSLLRKSEPEKAYFNCHTDITIPFEELQEIAVVTKDGREIPLIRDGLFVAEGTDELNAPLLRPKRGI